MPYELLFDLDGTLIDSSASILATFAAVLQQHRLAPVVSLDQRLIGPPLRATIEKLTGISDAAILDSLTDTFKRIYDTDGFRSTTAFPGVNAALQCLCDSGVGLTIVTNKREVPTRRIMELLGWQDVFNAAYSLDAFSDAAANKAELVRLIIGERKIDISRAAMVGDTREDMKAAIKNGLFFFGAAWGYGRLVSDDVPGEARVLGSPAEMGCIFKAA